MAAFDSTLIARAAAALYDTQLGSATMHEALDAVNGNAFGSVDALLNALYQRDFGAWTDAAVAALIVSNVGITGADAVAEATSVVTGALAASAAGQKGATVNALLTAYAGLTGNPAFGGFATAFNSQIRAAVAYSQAVDSTDVSASSTTGMVFTLTSLEANGVDVMHITGDQDVRIDFTNPNNQIVGLDLDGDGVIEFNGSERNITGRASGYEIVDAYSRNPLNHTDTANNFLGDIYFDGTSWHGTEGNGQNTDGNIFLGGLGVDTALGGVGNDFLAGGGIAQARFDDIGEDDDLDGDGDGDHLYGGRNADFFFAEFSMLDIVDGNGRDVLYIDGGNTSDNSTAGTVQTDQDNDWLLIEASDDDEPVLIELTEGDGEGVDQDDAAEVQTRSGQYMDIEDVENLDASGNLYGFLDDMTDGDGNQLRIGGRSYDSRYDDDAQQGVNNYGIGSSAQLNIDGTDVANIIIAGYDNDRIDGFGGADLIFGGNLQQLFETVEDGVTNLNLASITLDGMDQMFGGDGNDGLVWEGDSGTYDGEAGTDTLWLTNYALGTNTSSASTTDGRLRFDLGAQTDITDHDSNVEPGFAGYGGADRPATADQTNYAAGANTMSTTVLGIDILDASGLSTGVRGLDYFSAGTNETADAADDPAFSNRQNFTGYNGNLDLRGALDADNNLYAGAGDDVLEGRGGADVAAESATAFDLTLQGGDGNDDFYFSIDGDDGQDETNIIRRKVDANGDGWWDGSNADGAIGTWGADFGQNTVDPGESVLTIAITIGDTPVQISEAVNFISEIVTGVENEDGTFTEIVLNSAAIRAAQTYDALADAINDEIAAEYADEADNIVATVSGFSVQITDSQGRTLADDVAQVAGAGVTANQKANTDSGNIFSFGEPIDAISQDRIIFKSYEDRSDNEGVDDDAVTGSEVSLGTDAYAEDLVVSFGADGTRLAEDQEYTITFRNLATQDAVTVNVNGVTYTLTVGVAVNGSLIDGEDTRHTDLGTIQTNFLARLAGFINSFMDDDTAAGQVAATSTATTLTLTQVAYHDGEETVFMTTPVVTATNASGGERPTIVGVDNDAQTEVFLFQYDGRDGKLNESNVQFWGQESVSRSILQTAEDGASASAPGDTVTGSEALVINGGHGANDDDLDDAEGNDIPHNLATDDGRIDWVAATEFQEENFAVHGDDYLIGGSGDDTIDGRTGDDRVRGSLGNDSLDGGKDWYAILEAGDEDYHLEYLNAYEADERDGDNEVLDIQLVLQTESGHSLIAPTDDSPEEKYEAYFDDTLIYHQADFTVGVTRFTVTLNNYSGLGEAIVFDEGGAGTVGVDANGDGTVEPDNVSDFANFENIRTVSGVGKAVAGTGGGQGRDTLNMQQLSDDADVGVLYDLTGDDANGTVFLSDPHTVDTVVTSSSGDVILLEDLDVLDTNADDEDDLVVDSFRQMLKVDGVENIVFGDGNDVLLIDETEAAKDNVVTGDDGYDHVMYLNNFDGEDVEGDDEPTVTINVGNRHIEGASSSHDQVVMTEGRVGTVVATDDLLGVEEITLGNNTAGGQREDDELNLENLTAGASVSYVTGEVFSDTDGDFDFEDGELQVTINNLYEVEEVVADGEDGVIVADASTMSMNQRTDLVGEQADLLIDTFANYDLLDERGAIPGRLSVADLRSIDGGTARTADEDDIPEGYNFGQFKFSLGADTDTVDYSQSADSIAAVLDLGTESSTQYVLVDAQTVAADDVFDWLDDSTADRVDALTGVEQIVAALGESVIDLTASETDVKIDFTFDTAADDTPDDGDQVVSTVRIADGNGNVLENISQLVERFTFNDPFGDDGIMTEDDASWNRIEGSDANESVAYDGSENMPEQAGVDHRFTNDVLTLRGGQNSVSYFKLETSIVFSLNEISTYRASNPLGTGLITGTTTFADGDLDAEVNAATGTHQISAFSADNDLEEGSTLKIEASQDDEDVVFFNQGTDSYYIVDKSPGVIVVGNAIAGDTLTLTGFEFIGDGATDDIYTVDNVSDVWDDFSLFDNAADDRDTLQLVDLEEGIDFTDFANRLRGGAGTGDSTIDLEEINNAFGFDWDVLDISQDDGEDDLILRGDSGVLRPGDDSDEDGDGSDDNSDGLVDDADDLIAGDLGNIDTMQFFDGLWLTDTSVADEDTFVLVTTSADYSLEDGSGDSHFDTEASSIIGGIDELNFSLVTDTDLNISVEGNAAMILVGGAGDDSITGGGSGDTISGGAGNDVLDGGFSTEKRQVQFGGTLDGAAGSTITATFVGAGTAVVTLVEGSAELATGAGGDAVGAALAAKIRANLAAINAAALWNDDAELVNAIYSDTTDQLVFTFSSGVNVTGSISVVEDDASPSFFASAESVVSEGSDGGSDTFVFASSASKNGVDTINNFVATAAGGSDDVLRFDNFLGGVAVPAAAAVNIAAGLSTLGATNFGVVFNKGTLTAADIAVSAAAGKIAVEDNGKAVIISTADLDGVADGTSNPYLVYYVQDTNTSAAQTYTVTQVATINSLDEIGAADMLNATVAPPPPPPPPVVTLDVSAGAASVDEGAAAVFSVATTGLADGTLVSYTLSGSAATGADTATPLAGTVAVVGGAASLSVTMLADAATEGAETLTATFTVSGLTDAASVTVNDTSTGGGGGGGGFTVVDLSVGGTVTGTAAAEAFVFDYTMVGGRATKVDGVVTIDGFDATMDKLVFVDTGAGTVFTKDAFLALPGIVPVENPFPPVFVQIGLDPVDGVLGAVTLTGVASLATVTIETEA